MTNSEAVQRASDRLAAPLTAGLTPAESAWAQQSFERWVLPRRVEVGLAERDAQLARADSVADDLAAELASLEPRERWAAIVEAVAMARLAPLSHHAFQLATTALEVGEEREVLRLAAREIQAELEQLDQELAGPAPGIRLRIGPELSEALLDCRWVIHGGSVTSLRLGDFARADATGPTT